MPVDHDVLKTELDNDPEALGYAELAQDSEGLAALMNDPEVSSQTIIIPSISTGLAIAFLVYTDFEALTAWQQAYLQALCATETLYLIDPATGSPTPAFAALQALFPPNTSSGQNLAAKAARPCSRAEA